MKSVFKLVTKALGYNVFRVMGWPRLLPINYTVSVTNKCNSRCSTCYIWTYYLKNPDDRFKEFEPHEFSKVFESLGKAPYWFTFSGGEPFLRDDLSQICGAAVEYCQPKIINIPSNGLLPSVIECETKKILETIGNTDLVINLSLDGVNGKHDEIRGVRGNFEQTLETYERLKRLQEDYPNLSLGIHSVVSRLSIDGLLRLYDYVMNLEPDNYITEVAEERSELLNVGKDITPTPEIYTQFIEELSARVKNDYLNSKKRKSKVTQAFRLAYYQIAAKQLREQKQVIPCYAGFASCQITPFGDVWPCCVLGHDKVMGNLRENEYDFKKVWFSEEAEAIKREIKAKMCTCPLANAHYTSLLCNFRGMIQVILNMISVS